MRVAEGAPPSTPGHSLWSPRPRDHFKVRVLCLLKEGSGGVPDSEEEREEAPDRGEQATMCPLGPLGAEPKSPAAICLPPRWASLEFFLFLFFSSQFYSESPRQLGFLGISAELP